MEKNQLLQTLKSIRENAPKRNFKQSVDLIINLKDLDLKKPDNKVDVFVQLHYDRGKPVKICGLVGGELMAGAKTALDSAVLLDDFTKYASDKKKMKKLASDHAYFIAQANIMPQVASAFGKVLGSRGKMPNPKAGCVVPPNANLAPLAERLKKTVRVKVDTSPVYQVSVGTEDMSDDQIVDNVLTIYNALVHALPNDIHNIKNVYLKFTMSTAQKVGAEAKTTQQPTQARTTAAKPKATKKAAGTEE